MSFAYTSVIKAEFNGYFNLSMISNRLNPFERKIILLSSTGSVVAKVLDNVAFFTRTLSTLGIFLADDILKYFFLIFPHKTELTFHAKCLQWRQFAWNVKSCFLEEKKCHKFFVCWISPELMVWLPASHSYTFRWMDTAPRAFTLTWMYLSPF